MMGLIVRAYCQFGRVLVERVDLIRGRHFARLRETTDQVRLALADEQHRRTHTATKWANDR